MNYCRQTDGNLAALAAYQRQEDALAVKEAEWDQAKVDYVISVLESDKNPANDYSGLELIGEAFGELDLIQFRPVVRFISDALRGCDNLRRAQVDEAELGRIIWGLIRDRLDVKAEGFAEDFMRIAA